jgi:hypothetical protein
VTTAQGVDELTGEQLEQVFHAALQQHDVQGAYYALLLMAPRDPHRAERLLAVTLAALDIAKAVQRTEGTEAMQHTGSPWADQRVAAQPAPARGTHRQTRHAPTAADVARYRDWHHPHHRETHGAPDAATISYAFAPFTGTEPMPTPPDGVDVLLGGTWSDTDPVIAEARLLHQRIDREVRSARILWKADQYHRAVAAVLVDAAPALATWRRARAQLDEAYAAVITAPDNAWRATIARLVAARDAATTAARALDDHVDAVEELRDGLAESVHEETLSVEQIAQTVGVDVTGWPELFDPLARGLEDEIRDQDAHIAEINRLAGVDTDAAPQPVTNYPGGSVDQLP